MVASRETEQKILTAEPDAWIAGLDEAGRGPLAGPVSIGIAIFTPSFFKQAIPESLLGLTDSKKVSIKKREIYLQAILKNAAFATCVQLSSKVVDSLNINGAIEQAMMAAIHRAKLSGINIQHALLDGNYKFPKLTAAYPQAKFQSIIKGDLKVFSIAAASILAKTIRDHRMLKYDALFPGYGLAAHKGYGTQKHKQAIKELGPTAIHRRSFRW